VAPVAGAEHGTAAVASPRPGHAPRAAAVFEHHSARQTGLLTERTRRALWGARYRTRYVEAQAPGELVCLDTFYIGKLKGGGPGVPDHRVRRGQFLWVAAILPALSTPAYF
jgi:hypothetical protein